MLQDIHQGRDRTAIEVLQRYVASPDVVAMLADQLDHSWRDVRPGDSTTGPFMAELGTVLGPATANRHSAATARQQVWSAMIADATPYNLGALAPHRRRGPTLVDRRTGAEFGCAATTAAGVWGRR